MSAFGDSKEQQALIRELADTLVQREVIEPMDRIEWGHGTPPAPRIEGQPPAAEGAPTPEPVSAEPAVKPDNPAAPVVTPDPAGANKANTPQLSVDWESLKDPVSGKYLGKYNSITEAARGVGHAVTMAKEALVENARLRAQIATAQPAALPAVAPSAQPIKTDSLPVEIERSAKLADVLGKLGENGGVLDAEDVKALADGISDQTALAARHAVRETLRERESALKAEEDRWVAVNAHMERKYPGSTQFSDEIGVFVAANPLIAEGVNALVAKGKEIEAAEMVYEQFAKSREAIVLSDAEAAAVEKETKLAAADQVRQEAVEAARRDAGVLPTSASGVHESVTTGASRAEVDELVNAMRRQGTAPGSAAAAAWRAATIGAGLTGPAFDR